MPRTPTPRQRKAARAIVENSLSDRPLPAGQVLDSVGYGKIVQDPSRITGSQGFIRAVSESGLREALIAQGIDSGKIARKIDMLLEATRRDVRISPETGEYERTEEPDYQAIDKGVRHATAIHGLLQEQPRSQNTYNFILSPSFQERIRPLEDALKEQFRHARPTETAEEDVGAFREEPERP